MPQQEHERRVTPRMMEVARLARAGVPQFDIAQRLGLKHRTVRAMFTRLRRRGVEVPYMPPGNARYLFVFTDDEMKAQMESVAMERGVDTTTLCTMLMRRIVNDDLFNAVLGD